jgi:hypothetical protein
MNRTSTTRSARRIAGSAAGGPSRGTSAPSGSWSARRGRGSRAGRRPVFPSTGTATRVGPPPYA